MMDKGPCFYVEEGGSNDRHIGDNEWAESIRNPSPSRQPVFHRSK